MPPLNDSPLYALFLFAGMLGAVYGAGRGLTARVPGWLGWGERALFAVPLGIGIVGYVVLALGLLGLLRTPLFASILLVGLGGWAWFIRDVLADRKIVAGETTTAGKLPAWHLAAWFAVVFVGVCCIIACLAPPGALEWDGLSYHLANPKYWLRYGRIFYLPWDHHSNFPFTLEMLFLVMLGLGSIGAAKLCHFLCGAVLVLSVYTFARRHLENGYPNRSRTVGTLAALFLATTPVVLWEASVSYIDLATALFTWLSLYALVNASQVAPVSTNATQPAPGNASSGVTASVRWLVLSAVLMGFALGTKYTVLGFWGMMLVAVLGWHFVLYRRWARETIPHALLWGGVSLLIGAPWYLKNILITGNPVYPFAYNVFGGRYWSAQNAAQYAADQARFGAGKDLIHLLLGPWQVTLFPDPVAPVQFTEYYVFGLSPVFVALLLAAPFVIRRWTRPSVYLVLFGLGVYGFWFFLMQQTRYFVPALPAYALLCAEVLATLAASASIARLPAIAFATASALWGMNLAGGQAFWGVRGSPGPDGRRPIFARPAWPFVSGQQTREEYLDRALAGLYDACQWINTNTPSTAKVALLAEPRGFYLDRDYLWAEPDHAYNLLPWDTYTSGVNMAADLKRRGYTYLLVGRIAAPAPGQEPPRWLSLFTDAVQNDTVTPVYEDRGYAVYEVR